MSTTEFPGSPLVVITIQGGGSSQRSVGQEQVWWAEISVRDRQQRLNYSTHDATMATTVAAIAAVAIQPMI